MNNKCTVCGKVITPDEKGLTRKLVNRAANEFKCISCLATYFSIREKDLQDKIEQYKKMGCTLFK